MANDRILAHAERLLAEPVGTAALALAFEESTASSTDLLVEGASFFPRMLDDIAAASSSVHLNQFGFKPGVVGDAFAEALAAKAAHGCRRPVGRRRARAPIPTGVRAGSTKSWRPPASQCASCGRPSCACSRARSAQAVRCVGT